jgi:hypothetical protein
MTKEFNEGYGLNRGLRAYGPWFEPHSGVNKQPDVRVAPVKAKPARTDLVWPQDHQAAFGPWFEPRNPQAK